LVGIVDRFIFETEKHNGVAELLEILGRFVSAAEVTILSLLKYFLFVSLS